MRNLALVLTVVLIVAAPNARAQDTKIWLGKKVVFKDPTHCPIAATKEQGTGSVPVFTVKRANRDMLFLVAGQAGFWVPSHEILFQEELSDYLAKQRQLNPPQQRRPDPRDETVYIVRAFFRMEQKDYNHAIADFDEVLKLNPKNVRAYYGRGQCWQREREFAKAIADFDQAVQLNPRYWGAYNQRAWIWATCTDATVRDASKAIESARSACELTSASGKASCLDTLAAAYAEAGNFAEAVKAQTEANARFKTDGVRKSWQARLSLYQAKKPYRE
ncbi:MAG: tetratricopeptide repeat protein [Isosphaeraceae bacterium]